MRPYCGTQNELVASGTKVEIGVYGRGHGWDAGITADHWQLADFTLTEAVLPYNRMPRAYVHWERALGLRFVGGVDAEVVRFQHPEFDAGSRLRYATDASIYEIEPVGVLVPRSIDDVRAAIAICRRRRRSTS